MSPGASGSAIPPNEATLFDAAGVDAEVVTALVASLIASNQTVACAESLTGGLLTALLTEVPGSSAAVRGGIVCYATDLKSGLVDVDQSLLDTAGPVDPEVARQLAAGVRQRCVADIGIGLTGVAGPAHQHGHPPGTVYVAVDCDHFREMTALRPGRTVPGRAAVRASAVGAALELIARAVGAR